jgi:hypothetical protein
MLIFSERGGGGGGWFRRVGRGGRVEKLGFQMDDRVD